MNDCRETQRTRNAAYGKAYDEWVANLTPKKRRELEAQGLLRPEVETYHVGKNADVSELPIAADQNEAEEIAQEETDRIWGILRRLLGELLSSPNAQLSLECLALVSGVGFMGDSMTAIAKRHGITRAAVSKRCIEITNQLDLLPSRAMKSLTARQSYRTAQRKHYEHRERFDDRRHRRPGN